MKSSIPQRRVGLADRHSPTITLILTILLLLIALVGVARADVIDDLVPIVIQAESSGNPNASDGHSYGLMGISPCVLEDWNKTDKIYHPHPYKENVFICSEIYNIGDMYNPTKNIDVGTWYLYKIQSWLPEEYRNSKPHIIFAYNSGIGKLKANNWKIPSWTKNHPNRIYRKIYRGEL